MDETREFTAIDRPARSGREAVNRVIWALERTPRFQIAQVNVNEDGAILRLRVDGTPLTVEVRA